MRSIKEMIAVVQVYIMQRKDVNISIVIKNPVDLIKLTEAYNIANNWLNENNAKITKL